jgi:hypothetical protein
MTGVLVMEELRNETQDRAREHLLKLEDVADLLNVDISTARDWIKARKVPYSTISPQFDMQFRMDDIMAVILK